LEEIEQRAQRNPSILGRVNEALIVQAATLVYKVSDRLATLAASNEVAGDEENA
jgi:hypothetical protein